MSNEEKKECKLVCPHCTRPMHPEDRICKRCGAPVCVSCGIE